LTTAVVDRPNCSCCFCFCCHVLVSSEIVGRSKVAINQKRIDEIENILIGNGCDSFSLIEMLSSPINKMLFMISWKWFFAFLIIKRKLFKDSFDQAYKNPLECIYMFVFEIWWQVVWLPISIHFLFSTIGKKRKKARERGNKFVKLLFI
jgi:hypothetical protein